MVVIPRNLLDRNLAAISSDNMYLRIVFIQGQFLYSGFQKRVAISVTENDVTSDGPTLLNTDPSF